MARNINIGLRDNTEAKPESRLLRAQREKREAKARAAEARRTAREEAVGLNDTIKPEPQRTSGGRNAAAAERKRGLSTKSKVAAGTAAAATGAAILNSGDEDAPETEVTAAPTGLRDDTRFEGIPDASVPIPRGTGVLQRSNGLRPPVKVGEVIREEENLSRREQLEREKLKGFRRGGDGIFSALYDAGRLSRIRGEINRDIDLDTERGKALLDYDIKNRELGIKGRNADAAARSATAAEGRLSLDQQKAADDRIKNLNDQLGSENEGTRSAARRQLLVGVGQDSGEGEAFLMAEIAKRSGPGNALFDAFPDVPTAIRRAFFAKNPVGIDSLVITESGDINYDGQKVTELNDLPDDIAQALIQYKTKQQEAVEANSRNGLR